MGKEDKKAEFYKLNVATLPDELYRNEVPVEKWLEKVESTTDKAGFPTNTLNRLDPLEWDVEVERIAGIALYMISNPLPMYLVVLGIASFFSDFAAYSLMGLLLYVGILGAICQYFSKIFIKRYQRPDKMISYKDNQYLYTERNNCKYMNTTVVWPKSLHPPALKDKPVLYCAVPHGIVPFGITVYPMWSKIWNSKLCRWTCAPIVLRIPVIGHYMEKIGYMAAKAGNIYDTLTKKEENVGVILDGIAGMSLVDDNVEVAYLNQRKGIVKIALRAGAPIVPVYGFGHTTAYSIVMDPFGLIEYVSNKLQIAMIPFFGRFGWPMGPPRRVPITVCLGEPVECPQINEPTQADIDKYHALMVKSFQDVFNKHKVAYGWGAKKLKVV